MIRLRVVAVVVLLFLLAAAPADAGYLTGVGNDRAAHLADASNDLTVTVQLPETIDGQVPNAFSFTLHGSAGTVARPYTVRLTVSPNDPELALSWQSNVTGPVGNATAGGTIEMPADELPYRRTNVPFAVALVDASGAPVDSADFSVDLTYRPPPPDGGLFQLAGGTIAAWGLVLLYAVYLHRANQRLRSRADSLERAIGRSGKEGEK